MPAHHASPSLGAALLIFGALACGRVEAPIAPSFAGAPPLPIASPPPAAALPLASAKPVIEARAVAEPVIAPRGPSITIEPPYKLGEEHAPRGIAEEAEHARWNAGGRGSPPALEAPIDWHPEPRVIVNVLSVKGPLKRADAERRARSKLWGAIIACYRPGAARDPKLRGKTTLRLEAAKGGKIKSARVTATTMDDDAVVRCLAEATKRIQMPKAKSGSTVVASIQIAPGDDPVPPPNDALVAGVGSLAPRDVIAAISAELPRFQACYDAGLTSAPSLWGRLAMRLHVTASGEVDEAFEVESRFPDARVARCVLRETRATRFDAPDGGDLRIVVPLRFESGDPTP